MELRIYRQISMQGMAEVGARDVASRENQELFGCPGTGAHQNGSIGPEGTSLSVGARVGEGAESTQPTTQLSSAVPLYTWESGEAHSERGQAENYFSPNPAWGKLGARGSTEFAQPLKSVQRLWSAHFPGCVLAVRGSFFAAWRGTL